MHGDEAPKRVGGVVMEGFDPVDTEEAVRQLHRAGGAYEQDHRDERDDHVATGRVVPDVARGVSGEVGVEIGQHGAGPDQEIAKPCMRASDHAPREAEGDERGNAKSGDLVNAVARAAGDPGDDDARHEQPVKKANGPVPHQHALSPRYSRACRAAREADAVRGDAHRAAPISRP